MSRLARVAKLGSVVAVGTGSLVFVVASPAGAWTGTLQAITSCVGTVPTVTWTVTESIPGGAILVGDNFSNSSTMSSGVFQEPAGTTSATVYLHVPWANHGKPLHSDSSSTVTFPSGCVATTTTTTTTTTTVPVTTTTTTPTSTTTVATSSTTVAPTTTIPATTTITGHTSPGGATTTAPATTIPDGTTTTVDGSTPATAAPATAADGGTLAFTGYNAAETTGVGGLLIAGGGLLVWKSRRRKAAKHLKDK